LKSETKRLSNFKKFFSFCQLKENKSLFPKKLINYSTHVSFFPVFFFFKNNLFFKLDLAPTSKKRSTLHAIDANLQDQASLDDIFNLPELSLSDIHAKLEEESNLQEHRGDAHQTKPEDFVKDKFFFGRTSWKHWSFSFPARRRTSCRELSFFFLWFPIVRFFYQVPALLTGIQINICNYITFICFLEFLHCQERINIEFTNGDKTGKYTNTLYSYDKK
jgi:hypothetical protein